MKKSARYKLFVDAGYTDKHFDQQLLAYDNKYVM